MHNEDNPARRFKIERIAQINAANREDAVLWSISEVLNNRGEDHVNRNFIVSFKTKEEAELWVKENSN